MGTAASCIELDSFGSSSRSRHGARRIRDERAQACLAMGDQYIGEPLLKRPRSLTLDSFGRYESLRALLHANCHLRRYAPANAYTALTSESRQSSKRRVHLSG